MQISESSSVKRRKATQPKKAPKLRKQVAALCYRKVEEGKRILLVTSRDTGRWIIPKGWPMKGKTEAEAAATEAWEEAGVRGKFRNEAIGSYTYGKRRDDGKEIPVEAHVFPVKVKTLEDEFPERYERKRKWVSPKKAAKLVDEPELKEILKSI